MTVPVPWIAAYTSSARSSRWTWGSPTQRSTTSTPTTIAPSFASRLRPHGRRRRRRPVTTHTHPANLLMMCAPGCVAALAIIGRCDRIIAFDAAALVRA
jgi:hypothetical protein